MAVEYQKVAVSIPTPVFERAEKLAAARGITRSELYAQALAALLEDEPEPGSVTERLNHLYAAEASPPDAGLSALQQRVMEGDPW
jgi:hypothetical protein